MQKRVGLLSNRPRLDNMDGAPITSGYTINIVKKREQQAVLVLNAPNTNNHAYSLHVPHQKEDGAEVNFHEESIVVEESHHRDINDGFGETLLVLDTLIGNEVAHEEEVVGESLTPEPPDPDKEEDNFDFPVHCDICAHTFLNGHLAKAHMREVHSILTYNGPFFKCDFCSQFFTDRVSHMKLKHYSSLSQGFNKTGGSYKCIQCAYATDQLTNIRNHVDAKHNSAQNRYVCEECNSEYKTLNSMRAHKSRVHVRKKRKLREELVEIETCTIPVKNIYEGNEVVYLDTSLSHTY